MNAKDEDRFWSKVNKGKSDECWNWTAGHDKYGYGKFSIRGREVSSHRVAYQIANGSIPNGLCVLHKCDNPPCVNPAHLFVGTHADNVHDKCKKGRASFIAHKGEEHGRAKLNDAQVRQIRERYTAGGVTHRELAREYGVNQSVIGDIVRRELWRHVD
jgi:hypothetical protein